MTQAQDDSRRSRARELVGVVLLEAVGSSVTPFVPLPFVDDWLFARLLERIAAKVLAREAPPPPPEVAKAIVKGYMHAAEPPLHERAVIAAARFVARKVAIIFDVMKSHDVFGEAIAFALALDVAREAGAVDARRASSLGGAIHRAVERVGSAAIDVVTEATREALVGKGRGAVDEAAKELSKDASRVARLSGSVGKKVDAARDELAVALRAELQIPR
jgi:hypothetical protein